MHLTVYFSQDIFTYFIKEFFFFLLLCKQTNKVLHALVLETAIVYNGIPDIENFLQWDFHWMCRTEGEFFSIVLWYFWLRMLFEGEMSGGEEHVNWGFQSIFVDEKTPIAVRRVEKNLVRSILNKYRCISRFLLQLRGAKCV